MNGLSFPLNTHFRAHLAVGAVLALWLYLFLTFVGPFDSADLSLGIRSFLMIGYGFVFWGTYLCCIPMQNWLYHRLANWSLLLELAFAALFFLVCFLPTYAYYRTDAVNGTFSISEFLYRVYLPTTTVLIPILLLSRYLIGMPRSAIAGLADTPVVTLTGSNKQDVLRLPLKKLVAVSAADNYVAVHYLNAESLEKRLLRTTLSRIKEETPVLVQIHRSHLVNPAHFRSWQSLNVVQVHQLTLPVSKRYKAELEAILNFAPH